MQKPKLLFLSHRIPFPPDKGDKIRSFNILKYLSLSFEIHLGCFFDDKYDEQYIPDLKDYCHSVTVLPLDKKLSTIKSFTGFFTGEALTLPYYKSKKMAQWVESKLQEEKIVYCFVYSAAMAQYVENKASLFRVLDFVDMDSDKWAQYSTTKKWPVSWVYHREGIRLAEYEHKVAKEFDYSFFVSEAEANLFTSLFSDVQQKVGFFNNGVDAEYFSPHLGYPSPYPANKKIIAFTGAMDYWPNIDAVKWFAEDLFPHILREHQDAVFYIVGSNPGESLNYLANEHVVITGRVDDIRPYIHFADLIVAPLRIARGIQNKVLEAMAMEKTVMATDAALEGIQHNNQIRPFLLNENSEMIAFCQESLRTHNKEHNFRDIITKNYSWESSVNKLLACFPIK